MTPQTRTVNLRVRVVLRQVLASQKIAPELTLRVAEYIVGDDSASLVLQLRNGESSMCVWVGAGADRGRAVGGGAEQVDVVTDDGCDLEVRNGDVVMHDGYMRVAVLWGDVRLADAKHDFVQVNETGNVSRVQHTLLDIAVINAADSGR